MVWSSCNGGEMGHSCQTCYISQSNNQYSTGGGTIPLAPVSVSPVVHILLTNIQFCPFNFLQVSLRSPLEKSNKHGLV